MPDAMIFQICLKKSNIIQHPNSQAYDRRSSNPGALDVTQTVCLTRVGYSPKKTPVVLQILCAEVGSMVLFLSQKSHGLFYVNKEDGSKIFTFQKNIPQYGWSQGVPILFQTISHNSIPNKYPLQWLFSRNVHQKCVRYNLKITLMNINDSMFLNSYL